MPEDWVLDNIKIIAGNAFLTASIEIRSGKIWKVAKKPHTSRGSRVMDGRGLVALPGLIDAHVHMRDLDLSYKEDYYTGTCAAAAGGFTAAIDMPNTSPPTDSPESLHKKIISAQHRTVIDMAFHCLPPSDIKRLDELISSGVRSFKLYLGNLGSEERLWEILPTIVSRSKTANIPLTVHAEDSQIMKSEKAKLKDGKVQTIYDYERVHPPKSEARAVEKILKLPAKGRIHFCHISTSLAAQMIGSQKAALKATCEVTPHHLFLNREDLFRIGATALTNPPLRTEGNRRAMWRAIGEGVIDIIATDHAPHTLEEKTRPSVADVPPGIPGLETCLPLMLTGVDRGYIGLRDISRLLSANPARIFKIKGKGLLKKGFDADIILIDLKKESFVDPQKFFTKAKYSPFTGMRCKGRVEATIRRGEVIYQDGEIKAKPGSGMVLVGK